MSGESMTWGDFKEIVEAGGVQDGDVLEFIETGICPAALYVSAGDGPEDGRRWFVVSCNPIPGCGDGTPGSGSQAAPAEPARSSSVGSRAS